MMDKQTKQVTRGADTVERGATAASGAACTRSEGAGGTRGCKKKVYYAIKGVLPTARPPAPPDLLHATPLAAVAPLSTASGPLVTRFVSLSDILLHTHTHICACAFACACTLLKHRHGCFNI